MSGKFGFAPSAAAMALLIAVTLPLWSGNRYQLHLAALICVYWILIAGLNLVVGYTGQLSIGHVGLLAIGAYAFSILAGTMGWHPALALLAAGALCGFCGLVLGLPSSASAGLLFRDGDDGLRLDRHRDRAGPGRSDRRRDRTARAAFSRRPSTRRRASTTLAALLAGVVTLLSWNNRAANVGAAA